RSLGRRRLPIDNKLSIGEPQAPASAVDFLRASRHAFTGAGRRVTELSEEPVPLASNCVNIIAALFVDGIDVRPVEGPSTRIDLTGVKFSEPAAGPVPVTVAPHLVVLVHCGVDEKPTGALEVVFWRNGEQIARNVQALQVEPGKFNYRLVRAELEFTDYESIEAHCRIDMGPATVVPFTLLPPVT
ncbi:MAG: hypothetical protein ACRD0U_03420, partial [Acidimicrobiales bacterium]